MYSMIPNYITASYTKGQFPEFKGDFVLGERLFCVRACIVGGYYNLYGYGIARSELWFIVIVSAHYLIDTPP